MPPIEEFHRHQKAVLWPFSDRHDPDGEVIVDDPVEIDVRWEDEETLMRDPDGNLIPIIATVVAARVITIGSIMWLGKLADFDDSQEQQLRKVSTYREVPDLKGRFVRRIVGLTFYRGILPTLS